MCSRWPAGSTCTRGHDACLAAFPARVVHALGANALIVSNAAGGVNRHWQPGDLMLIRDHINLTFRNPLFGPVEPGDHALSGYVRAVRCWSSRNWRERSPVSRALCCAKASYAALLGPTYETPAEVRALSVLGADAVGMSTVPEVIVARAIGMRVLGVSWYNKPGIQDCRIARSPTPR